MSEAMRFGLDEQRVMERWSMQSAPKLSGKKLFSVKKKFQQKNKQKQQQQTFQWVDSNNFSTVGLGLRLGKSSTTPNHDASPNPKTNPNS